MKSKLAMACLAMALTGCSSIHGTRTLPDGTTLAVHSTRWFWASESITAGTKDAQGFEFTLVIGKSSSDSQSIGAVAKGIAEGVVKGMSPAPTP